MEHASTSTKDDLTLATAADQRALAAIRLAWAGAYDIGIDSAGRWRAAHKDGIGVLTAGSSDELWAAIIEDFTSHPLR